MPVRHFFAVAMLATLALTGCDSDDEGGVAKFATDVEGSAKLGDLTDDQRAELCTDVDSFLAMAVTAPSSNTIVAFSCRMAGIMAAAMAQTGGEQICDAAEQSCLDDPGSADDVFEDDDSNESDDDGENCDPEDLVGCDASVDEAAACLDSLAVATADMSNDVESMAQEALENTSCDDIPNSLAYMGGLSNQTDDLDDENDDMETPQCKALYEKCPQLED